MKKILVTTLALSLAIASTMDARRVSGSPAQSQRQISIDIQNAAQNLKDAPKTQKEVALQELMTALEQDANLAELTGLEIQRKKIISDLEDANAKLKEIKTGWVFHSSEYKEQQTIVNQLNSKLKDKNKEIAAVKKDLPKESIVTVNRAIIAAVAVAGIFAVLEYWYRGDQSYVRSGLQTGSGYLSSGYEMLPDVPGVGAKARAGRKAAAATGK